MIHYCIHSFMFLQFKLRPLFQCADIIVLKGKERLYAVHPRFAVLALQSVATSQGYGCIVKLTPTQRTQHPSYFIVPDHGSGIEYNSGIRQPHRIQRDAKGSSAVCGGQDGWPRLCVDSVNGLGLREFARTGNFFTASAGAKEETARQQDGH